MELALWIVLIILVGGFFGKWQERWTDKRVQKGIEEHEARKRRFGGE